MTVEKKQKCLKIPDLLRENNNIPENSAGKND